MMHSNTATMVVSAARVRKRKKKNPQTRPPAMLAKTLGRATKMSPGPEVTSTP